MNESIKTFSLVIITVCVFIITIIDVVNLVNKKNQMPLQNSVIASPTPSALNSNTLAPSGEQPGTTMKFFETQFDFGTIKQGDVVKHNFEFMNTGTAPLLIQSATSSCGCTVPSYPKDPLAPGAKGMIEVQFNSANKNGLVNKNVTVTANTDPPTNVLNITANVENK